MVQKSVAKSFNKEYCEHKKLQRNRDKDMKTEQINIFHKLELFSLCCNSATRMNSKPPVRLNKVSRH